MSSTRFPAPGFQFEPQIIAQLVRRLDATATTMHDPEQNGLIDPGFLADLIPALARCRDGLSYVFENHDSQDTL
jgi:hypothetical protein